MLTKWQVQTFIDAVLLAAPVGATSVIVRFGETSIALLDGCRVRVLKKGTPARYFNSLEKFAQHDWPV